MAPKLPPASPAANKPVDAAPALAEGGRVSAGTDSPGAVVDLAGLIIAHHAALYRYAYRLCGCATEADDLTQQAFLVAQQRLHQLRDAERAGAWLYAVLRSCFLKSLRRQRPANAATLHLEVEEFAGPLPAAEEIDRERLAAALADLTEEFRLVVLMFYFEDLSYQEIAEQLEIPIGTVMSRLSRAKGHLRRLLGDDAEENNASAATVVSPATRTNGASREVASNASLRSTKPVR
jgi:RNA polymerase sigma-70 factor (ECF subfamily)